MPASHIVSRIQQIEGRIQEIQKISSTQKPANTTPSTQTRPNGDTFSEILNEVMKSQNESQLNLLSDSDDLLSSRTDTLMEIYKATGEMPVSQPQRIPKNEVYSSNPGTWDNIITDASKAVGVDENLIHAIIQAESAYKPNAISRVGAEGLMQLMPATAERIGVTDSFDPQQNIYGGTKVIKEMLERYNGNLINALAAYNAGPDAVDRAGGIPRYKETQEYVPKVLNFYYNMKHR